MKVIGIILIIILSIFVIYQGVQLVKAIIEKINDKKNKKENEKECDN